MPNLDEKYLNECVFRIQLNTKQNFQEIIDNIDWEAIRKESCCYGNHCESLVEIKWKIMHRWLSARLQYLQCVRLEMLQSCTKPSIFSLKFKPYFVWRPLRFVVYKICYTLQWRCMSVMVYLVTGNWTVCPMASSCWEQRNLQSSASLVHCEWNQLAADECPSQRASNFFHGMKFSRPIKTVFVSPLLPIRRRCRPNVCCSC